MDTFLVVDDHPLFLDALLLALSESFSHAQVLGASSAEEGLLIAAEHNPKLIVLDMGLPGASGAEAVYRFRNRFPESIIAVVSSSDDRREVAAVFRIGAQIFVSKSTPKELLISSISDALAGQLTEPKWVVKEGEPSELAPLPNLTTRQREILSIMMQGQSNKEIALRLNLSEVTVKMHVTAVFKSLGVINRTQAVLVARRLALGTLDT